MQVLFLFFFSDLVVTESTWPVGYKVKTDNFQTKAPLRAITEDVVTMKTRSVVITKVKKLINQLSVQQPTKISTWLKNTELVRKKRAAAANAVAFKNATEVIQGEKVKIGKLQQDCSQKFFHVKNRLSNKLVIVIYIRSKQEYGRVFAESLD